MGPVAATDAKRLTVTDFRDVAPLPQRKMWLPLDSEPSRGGED